MEYKTYAQFGSATFTGGIVDIKLLQNDNGEFLAITLKHAARGETHKAGVSEFVIKFYSSDRGLLGLYKKGWLPLGRKVTVMGKITDIETSYEKDGATYLLKNPRLQLSDAVVVDGGLGPAKQDKMPSTVGQVISGTPIEKQQQPEVEKTPETVTTEF